MNPNNGRRNVFISHHHADDDAVTKLTTLLKSKGHDIRNSSIRAKPANQERLDKGLVSDDVIRRILRMKIAWAGTTIVLIGKDTHKRPWVDWEINQAHRKGKRIIGVYERGGTEADVPEALEKYASSIVAWNTESIMNAVDGKENNFENPDGSSRSPVQRNTTCVC